MARTDTATCLKELGSQMEGLSDSEAAARLKQYGSNEIDREKRQSSLMCLLINIFDYATFFLMLYVFDCWNNPALFHTGWFVESLFTQTLIIHVIRTNKIPFIQSRASWQLILTSVIIVAAGAWLTVSPLADALGFVPLPLMYWLYLVGMLLGYALLTQLVKSWFIRRFGE